MAVICSRRCVPEAIYKRCERAFLCVAGCDLKVRLCRVLGVKQKNSPWGRLGQTIQAVSRFHLGSTSRRGLFVASIVTAALVITLFGTAPRAIAQLTILHNFGDGTVPNDGSTPLDGLMQTPDGSFYGVTLSHVLGRGGVIFRINPSGTYSIAENFNGPYCDYVPLYYNKELIGAYIGRLAKKAGVVFSLTGYPNGPWSSHIWHIFTGQPNDGKTPVGRLILGSDGNLYGVTDIGGTANLGTIYKVDPTSHQVTIVYSFAGSSPVGPPVTSLLLAADGNYYGGTSPSVPSPGEIYKMTPSGHVSTFYQFSGIGSAGGPLIQGSDGNFYGVGFAISGSFTSVFKLTKAGVLTVLHTFTTADSLGVVQGPNGYLYGVTNVDGTAKKGTVYEVSTDGSTFNVLHNFGDGSVKNDGASPDGILTVGTDNNLYGVTTFGGSAGHGTVFKISP
jgi:uncharacterized repeat protein (TIGR03803 family)